MRIFKRVMFYCLINLFGWQYGASAFHHYDKSGSLSCVAYCSQYGEKEAANAGVFSIYSYDAGVFKSCQCFTTAEIDIIKNCQTKSCSGTNSTGYLRAYIYNSSSATWCTENQYTTINCSCEDGYRKTGITSCTACPCGYKCTGGTATKCGAGTYSAAASSSCTTCTAGAYCGSGACSPTQCPDSPNATSASGSSSVYQCYYPKDMEMTDDVGTYLFTSNCFYSA